MSKERYNQIIDDAYENALLQYGFQWLPATQAGTSLESKESFIARIKTDKEFSERFGLKIEERELAQRERVKLLQKAWKSNDISPEHEEVSTMWIEYKNLMEKYNIPTKLITVTYNDETIEIYE
jgi:8-oxo-dGTP pyrophosphatase MutT (NUDIX family)